MANNNKPTKRESVALLGLSATAPELFYCGDNSYELEAYGKTYKFKAKDTMDALEKIDRGEYK